MVLADGLFRFPNSALIIALIIIFHYFIVSPKKVVFYLNHLKSYFTINVHSEDKFKNSSFIFDHAAFLNKLV